MRTPEDEADFLVADMKEKSPPRQLVANLDDDTCVRDIGYGTIHVYNTDHPSGIFLGPEAILKLVEYIATINPESL